MTCSPLQKHPNFGKNIDVIPLLNKQIDYFSTKKYRGLLKRRMMMKGLGILSDFDLVVAYEHAIKLNLDRDFKEILLVEMDRRGIRNHKLSVC